MALRDDIVAMFSEKSGIHGRELGTITCEKLSNGFELTVGAMYESPPLDVGRLMALVEMFGTKDIDVDNYSISGCETCDWGSNYGHTLQIRGATKRLDELEAWAAQEGGA